MYLVVDHCEKRKKRNGNSYGPSPLDQVTGQSCLRAAKSPDSEGNPGGIVLTVMGP